MKKRDIRDYLQDIADAIKDIEDFTQNLSYAQFVKDKKTVNAVIRSIEIVGEASKQLPESLKTKYCKVPWKEIAGMRDKLIHAYFGMDTETIWQTAKTNIPSLKSQIKEIQNNQEQQ